MEGLWIRGRDRLKTMTLDAAEFLCRFLIHLLPTSFHRIRHCGLFAGAVRAQNVERARQLLATPEAAPNLRTPRPTTARRKSHARASRSLLCGGRMIIIETFDGVRPARSPSPSRIRIDTS